MLALVAEHSGPSLWRVFQPIRALQAAGYPCGWTDWRAADTDRLAHQFDGFMLPRIAWPPERRRLAAAWFRTVQQSGRFVVFECDDDLFTSGITHRTIELGLAEGKSFERLEAERAERIWAMTQCDGVTVSTPRLATIVRSYFGSPDGIGGLTTAAPVAPSGARPNAQRLSASEESADAVGLGSRRGGDVVLNALRHQPSSYQKPVIVVPNAIDLIWFRSVVRATRRQISGLTIGWAGGQRHDRDLEPMAEAWRRIATRYPDVRFVVQGHVPAVVVNAVPQAQLLGVPWMPLESYPAGLAQVDIACCCLADTPFNRAKSPIKAMEAAAAGSAVVASPFYASLVEHGQTGYIAETADDWEHALEQLVTRPSLRSLMAGRLLRTVEKHHSLARNLWRWPAAWAEIQESARSRRGKLLAV
jgi:glycosyltransferase involved in cell wall biosynthesis